MFRALLPTGARAERGAVPRRAPGRWLTAALPFSSAPGDNASGGQRDRLIGRKTAVANDRNLNGTFAPGNPGGPGRPRQPVERQYLAALVEAVSPADWRAIVGKAVADAKGGNPKAREWLAKYLLGDDPFALVELADELQRLKSQLGVGDDGGRDPARTGQPRAHGPG